MTVSPAKRRDNRASLRVFLLLEGFVRLTLWYTSIAFTGALFTALGGWPAPNVDFIGGDIYAAWRWGEALSQLVLLYNIIYLLELLIYPAIYLLWKRHTDFKRGNPEA